MNKFEELDESEPGQIHLGQMLNPKKYGLVQCPHCNGYGSSLKEESDRCTKCGGSGLIKKEDAR